VRKLLRKKELLSILGVSNSTLYMKIAAGIFPKSVKLDPDGRAVGWFADEIEALLAAASERRQHPTN
jgi:prophage regulatory protein